MLDLVSEIRLIYPSIEFSSSAINQLAALDGVSIKFDRFYQISGSISEISVAFRFDVIGKQTHDKSGLLGYTSKVPSRYKMPIIRIGTMYRFPEITHNALEDVRSASDFVGIRSFTEYVDINDVFMGNDGSIWIEQIEANKIHFAAKSYPDFLLIRPIDHHYFRYLIEFIA